MLFDFGVFGVSGFWSGGLAAATRRAAAAVVGGVVAVAVVWCGIRHSGLETKLVFSRESSYSRLNVRQSLAP